VRVCGPGVSVFGLPVKGSGLTVGLLLNWNKIPAREKGKTLNAPVNLEKSKSERLITSLQRPS